MLNRVSVCQVWIDCHGEQPADRENIGLINYYPKLRGFHQKYFPFMNQPNYQSPLVAIQFEKRPPAGTLLHIECRGWAKNIGYDYMTRVGRAHFELLVHSDATASKVNEGQ